MEGDGRDDKATNNANTGVVLKLYPLRFTVSTVSSEALITVVRALAKLDGESSRRVIEAACAIIGVKVTFEVAPVSR